MARRSTPERIDQEGRDVTRNRLIGPGLTAETADAWIAAWTAQAAQDGIESGPDHWDLLGEVISAMLESEWAAQRGM